MDVQGNVTRHGSGAVLKGTLLDARSWIDLDKGASLTFRHVDSAREVTIKGPAYVTVCPHGEEEVLLTRGELTTTTGAGARPGAEVLVATPFAAVVYGNAKLDVRVGEHGTDLAVQAGDAWLRAAPGVKLQGEEHVMSGKKAHAVGSKADPNRLLSECNKAAEEAAQRARELLARRPEPDAGSLGGRAAAHVRARQTARERCAVAGAAAGLTPDPAERQRQWALLGRADRLWMSVPGRSE